MDYRKYIYYILLLIFIIPVSSGYTQQLGRNLGARYYLGSDDELLIPINIWGYVQNPGQYMVPNNTDLISLLSYAGGPKESAKISKIRIIRRSTVNNKNETFIIDVKKYLNTADETLIPLLKPDDTIIVKGSTFSWIQKFFSFLASFAVFAQMLYFIALAEERFNK